MHKPVASEVVEPSLTCPKALVAGDTVRVIAPCGAFDAERFAAGVSILEEAEFHVIYEPHIASRRRYLAGDDARRIGELQEALADDRAAALWVVRGGYGATRLLPQLALDAVRRANRWLIGFSDVTALHGMWARAGLCSMHGANVTTLSCWSAEARGELFALLSGACGEQHFVGEVAAGRGGVVEGPLVGGNLTVLTHMVGTGFFPPTKGAVVLLEDVGESPYRLDRSLTQMVQAGVFDHVTGFVIGQLTDCRSSGEDEDALSVVIETLVDGLRGRGVAAGDVPILTGIPIGHDPSSRPVVLGWHAELNARAGTLITVRPRPSTE